MVSHLKQRRKHGSISYGSIFLICEKATVIKLFVLTKWSCEQWINISTRMDWIIYSKYLNYNIYEKLNK